MDYKHHYDRLIERARNRSLTGYKERHHIIPRCMSGDNSPENLVYLTAEEHFVAHQLLIKIHPKNHKLIYAATAMTRKSKNQERVNNKLYGWLKRKKTIVVSEQMKGNKIMVGRTLSTETKEKISASLLKKNMKHNQKQKDTLAKSNRDRVYTPEYRENMADAQRGKKHEPEAKRKLSEFNKGKILSPEHRAKIGLTKIGNTYCLGKNHSEESKKKMSASMTGITKSKEHIEKIAAANRGKKASLETRAKMSAIQSKLRTRLGVKHTPGTIEKIRVAVKKQQNRSIDGMLHGLAAMTPEQRSERTRKSWVTRRLNKEVA